MPRFAKSEKRREKYSAPAAAQSKVGGGEWREGKKKKRCGRGFDWRERKWRGWGSVLAAERESEESVHAHAHVHAHVCMRVCAARANRP